PRPADSARRKPCARLWHACAARVRADSASPIWCVAPEPAGGRDVQGPHALARERQMPLFRSIVMGLAGLLLALPPAAAWAQAAARVRLVQMGLSFSAGTG